MTWAGRRQAIILGVIAVIVVAILFPIVKPIVAPEPTCSDSRQNQGELGVDCSGPCQKVCPSEAAKVSVLWARPFKVAEGVVSAVAYISNPNPSFEARDVRYTMRVYDSKNLLVAERYGKVNIPAKTTFPVFEGGISSGKTDVKTAFFQFLDEPAWERSSGKTAALSLGAPRLEVSPLPKISVTGRNDSSQTLQDVPIIAIVFDAEGNAIAASETVIDRLPKNEITEFVFTWGLPFAAPSSRIEVYPVR